MDVGHGVNLKVKFSIDIDLVDRAESEAFEILLNQRLSFNNRWYSRPSVVKAMPVLRMLGLVLSMLGATLSVFIVTTKPAWCPAWLLSGGLTLFFILAGALFYFFPVVDRSIKNWVKNVSIKGCRKLSKKCVKAARKAAPCQVEYDIKGDLITYYRGKDDDWKLAWSRKLKGVAIHGESTTIFFKKWTSFQPIMVVIHTNFEAFEKVFKDLNIEFKSILIDKE